MPLTQVQQCIRAAASQYQVPELLLYSILRKENGRVGHVSRNRNGTYDYGPAQINSSHLPVLGKYGITASHLVWSPCINVGVSAWVLRTNYERQGKDWARAIVAYNIGNSRWTPQRYRIGYAYARDVIRIWHEYDRAARRRDFRHAGSYTRHTLNSGDAP